MHRPITVPSSTFSAANQRGSAVALVVVCHRAAAAGLQRQPRLRAIQRLDLALLLDRQHHRVSRRTEVEAGFFLTGGEPHDLVGADRLLQTMEADMLIADKALDADARVLEPLAAASKTAVLPPRANRSSPRDYDRELYAARHLIENFFAKIKQFRAIATRYEKTARNFLSVYNPSGEKL